MKPILFPLTCFIIISTAVISCKKSADAPAVDETAQLTRNWVLTAATLSPAIGGITDFFNDWWDACDRDNVYKFQAGGVYINDPGALTCSASSQTRTGVWTYNKNNKELYFNAGDYYTMKVFELDNTHFKATTKDTISGVIYTSTWTFKAQ